MDTKYDYNSFVLPVTRVRRRKQLQRSMFCVQAVIITHELHPWEPRSFVKITVKFWRS